MMKYIFLAYLAGRITAEELHRYHTLHNKLMGTREFVEPDFTDPDWKEFNRITLKVME